MKGSVHYGKSTILLTMNNALNPGSPALKKINSYVSLIIKVIYTYNRKQREHQQDVNSDPDFCCVEMATVFAPNSGSDAGGLLAYSV